MTKIWQKDSHHFVIEWNDGKVVEYRLSDLQKRCPCASCNEKKSRTIDPNVQAEKIVSVGRYALRVTFTSGCSLGIYSFDTLYEMGGIVK